MIEGIGAVTLGTHEMPRAVQFYRALGFEVLYGGGESSWRDAYHNVIFRRDPRLCGGRGTERGGLPASGDRIGF